MSKFPQYKPIECINEWYTQAMEPIQTFQLQLVYYKLIILNLETNNELP